MTLENMADKYFKEEVELINRYGTKDESPRPKYSDGSPAHTFSINQVCRKYSIENNEFPIMTLRPQAWKSAIKEMLWIYVDGNNNLDVLRNKYGVKYWDDWDIGDGTIGHRYGYTFNKHYNLKEFIMGLKNDPFGRRHIIDLWQMNDFKESDGLLPCAFLTMWNVRRSNNGSMYLDMTLVQRSGDMCAASGAGGINEIQYYALMLIVCKFTGYKPGCFCHFVQNEQIYDRHIENALTMLKRDSVGVYDLVFLCDDEDIENVNISNISINNFKMCKYIDEYHYSIFNNTYMDDVKKVNPQLRFDLGI